MPVYPTYALIGASPRNRSSSDMPASGATRSVFDVARLSTTSATSARESTPGLAAANASHSALRWAMRGSVVLDA